MNPEPSGANPPPDPSDLATSLEEMHALRRAEQARHSEELLKFAYVISHDLREPLRTVTSYTQLLSRRYQTVLDKDALEFMGYILDAVGRMDRFLTDLVNYSNQLRVSEKPLVMVDPEGVLQGVLLGMDTEIRNSGAEITHDALPTIRYDSEGLGQIFRQLISNSITFRGASPPVVHISGVEGDRETTFEVRDNGVGIEARYHDQVFDAFRRLHGREYPGSGLGLTICKRIVEGHGGRIWVESAAGNGAVFRFTTPN